MGCCSSSEPEEAVGAPRPLLPRTQRGCSNGLLLKFRARGSSGRGAPPAASVGGLRTTGGSARSATGFSAAATGRLSAWHVPAEQPPADAAFHADSVTWRVALVGVREDGQRWCRSEFRLSVWAVGRVHLLGRQLRTLQRLGEHVQLLRRGACGRRACGVRVFGGWACGQPYS